MAKNSFTFNPFTGTLDVVQAPTGTGDRVAVFDTNGDLVSSANLTYIDTATDQRDLLVAGPVDSTVTTYFGVEIDTILDGQSLGDATFVAAYPQVGNSGNATSVSGTVMGIVSGPTIGADATLNSYQGFSERTSMLAGAVAPFYTGVEITPQLNQAVVDNVNGTVIGMNLGNNAGNPTIQNVSELAMYSHLYSGATVTGGLNSINLSTTFDTGSVITNGYTVMNLNPQISTGMNSVRGVQMSGNYGDGDPAVINSVVEVQASARFAADAQISNHQELILSSSFEAGATLQSGQTAWMSTQFDGQDVDNFTALSINTQTDNTTNIDNYQDINISTQFSNGTTMTNYQGINVQPNLGSATTDNFTGINIAVSGTPTVTNTPVGLQINMDNFVSANRTAGLNVQAQSNGIFANFTPVDNTFFDQGNGINSQMNVLAGSPLVGTDVICNNFAGLVVAEDDVAYGPLSLGASFVGFVGQASVLSGKTVDGINGALAGFSIPATSTGGTVTDVTLYRGITPFSAGGTLTITNLYGMKLPSDLSSGATNAWNIYAPDATAKTLLASGVTMVGNSNEVAIKASASTTGAYTLTLPVDDGASGEVLTTDGSGVLSWTVVTPPAPVAPTVQKFTSGSGTYTTPSSPAPLYIKVRMLGAGGGGGGSGTTSGAAGSAGAATTFGSGLLSAGGGSSGARGAVGGAGGTASLGAAIGTALSGGGGGIATAYAGAFNTTILVGGYGANSALGNGASGGSGLITLSGDSAGANSGGGGGGGGPDLANNCQSGSGGGSGAFVDAIITSPAATYAYVVGAGGSGQAAGTDGGPGGSGGSGYIEVVEYYQ